MPPQIINWAIPGFVALLLLELAISAFDQKELFDTKDTLASLSMGIGNVIVGILGKVLVFGAFLFVYHYRVFTFDMLSIWAWVILFFAEDLSYYIFHRASHNSRYLWASHVVHHSSEKYNLSTALRQTWTGNFSGSFVFWLWLPLIGFHPVMVMTMMSISLIYQFWIHTELIGKMWRPIEFIFNTPSHHRVHHGSDIKYLDLNHAGVLIIWDRLFGTFQEEEEKPTYGLRENINSHNPIKIAFNEWGNVFKDVWNAPTFRAKAGYLFGPPGWSHDGSTKTTKELRSQKDR